MNPEKTYLYKKQYQQPIEEETPPQKGKSKTAATSDSRKRSKHKHIYKKSSYTMVVTHFVGEDNAKFAVEWILHINLLIGTPRSFR